MWCLRLFSSPAPKEIVSFSMGPGSGTPMADAAYSSPGSPRLEAKVEV
jgi:hypothetical protein